MISGELWHDVLARFCKPVEFTLRGNWFIFIFILLPLAGACVVLTGKNVPSRLTRIFFTINSPLSVLFMFLITFEQHCTTLRRESKIIVLLIRIFSCNYRLVTEFDEGGSLEVNTPGCYPTVCVELGIDGLAVNAVLQVYVFGCFPLFFTC